MEAGKDKEEEAKPSLPIKINPSKDGQIGGGKANLLRNKCDIFLQTLKRLYNSN